MAKRGSHAEQSRAGSNQFQDRAVCKACGKLLLVVFPGEVDEHELNSTKWAQRQSEEHHLDIKKLQAEHPKQIDEQACQYKEEVAKLKADNEKLALLLEVAERKLSDVRSVVG